MKSCLPLCAHSPIRKVFIKLMQINRLTNIYDVINSTKRWYCGQFLLLSVAFRYSCISPTHSFPFKRFRSKPLKTTFWWKEKKRGAYRQLLHNFAFISFVQEERRTVRFNREKKIQSSLDPPSVNCVWACLFWDFHLPSTRSKLATWLFEIIYRVCVASTV